jgi:hypothetical protein
MSRQKRNALRPTKWEKFSAAKVSGLPVFDAHSFDADVDAAELELCEYGVTVRPKENREVSDGSAVAALDEFLLPEACK